MAREACVITTINVGELDTLVRNLSSEGYRIVSVFVTLDERYCVVAQEEIMPTKQELPKSYGTASLIAASMTK